MSLRNKQRVWGIQIGSFPGVCLYKLWAPSYRCLESKGREEAGAAGTEIVAERVAERVAESVAETV